MDFTRIAVVARNSTATAQLDAFIAKLQIFHNGRISCLNLNRQYKCFRQYIDPL